MILVDMDTHVYVCSVVSALSVFARICGENAREEAFLIDWMRLSRYGLSMCLFVCFHARVSLCVSLCA